MTGPATRTRHRVERPSAETPGPAQLGRRRPWRRPPRWLALALLFTAVAVLAAGAGVYVATRPKPEPTATLMQLDHVPHRRPPDFTLTDQHGQVRSLASFRGKPVALYFMDPRCTDVCPIVAQEFIEADRDLGSTASKVALIGVDVNPTATAEHWVRSFDREHGLDKLPNWYFFTGSLKTLESVWQKYTLNVQVGRTGAVVHTTIIDFIGRHGYEHRMAVPQAYERPDGTGYLPAGQVTQWGHGIAQQLRRLLPP